MTKEKGGSAGNSLAAVILAAGRSTRMRTAVPKALHPLAGRPLLGHVLEALSAVHPARTVVVTPPDAAAFVPVAGTATLVEQGEPLGTADAVLRARKALAGFDGGVLIVFGDSPLLTAATVERMAAARAGSARPAIVVLGFEAENPAGYGRLVTGPGGALERIVEDSDASPAERAIALCNSGMMLVDGAALFSLLEDTGSDNARGERYLTAIVALARARGLECAVVRGNDRELMGINTRADLAAAEAAMQIRLRSAALAGGATLVDPLSVYFSFDTRLGEDVTIEPGVVFGPGVVVGNGVTVRAFSHIEGAVLADGASVGPFARLRPGTHLATGARVGNFVEVKNASLGAGAKANHLTYLGDADIGTEANIGAGTITCNYDGFTKSRTEIGRGAFIGSNSALVAPVRIGPGAVVGAGSTITRDVAADAVALTRAPQEQVEGGAGERRRRAADRAGKKKA